MRHHLAANKIVHGLGVASTLIRDLGMACRGATASAYVPLRHSLNVLNVPLRHSLSSYV